MSDEIGSLSGPFSGIRDDVDERLRTLPAVFFVLIFLADLGANLYGINFSTFWHPDEIGKALQLRTGVFDFHHPLLLLRLASIAEVFPPGSGLRDIVLSGRVVSAVAVAVGVASCGTLIARRFGLAFGFVAAALVAMTPAVFVSAHFFKEDAVLLMGVALTMLALQAMNDAPTKARIMLFGLTLGIVFSAKYVGAVMAVPVVALYIADHVKLTDLILCFSCACLVFIAINAPAILGSSSLTTGLVFEIEHVTTGHDGVVWGPLSPRNLILFWQTSSSIIIAIWLVGMVLFFKKPQPMDAMVLFTPLLWLVAAQLSMVAFSRYTMPAAALTSVAAVWTVANGVRASVAWRPKVFPIVVLAFGGTSMLPPLASAASAFVDNPRDRTISWIRNNLPSDAKIATEYYAGLPTPELLTLDPTIQLLPQFVSQPFFHLGSAGDLSSLREKGFTHIVISSSHFDRFFDRFATLSSGVARQRKRFYEEAFTTLNPIHEETMPFETDEVLSSRILIYDIRK